MSAAIRRLGSEQKAMMDPKQRNPDIFAAPLEDNIYEWHFTIRGPYHHKQQQQPPAAATAGTADTTTVTSSSSSLPTSSAFPVLTTTTTATQEASPSSVSPETHAKLVASRAAQHVEDVDAKARTSNNSDSDCTPVLGYEKGLYHGALLFTPNFPYEPPDIMFFTPTGRFQCNVKICSSISQYHKEHWQPTYNVSFILQSLREFMRLEDEEGVGTVNKESVSRKQKQTYAEQSWEYHCPKCGCLSSETYEKYMEPYVLSNQQQHGGGSSSSSSPTPLAIPTSGQGGGSASASTAVGAETSATTAVTPTATGSVAGDAGPPVSAPLGNPSSTPTDHPSDSQDTGISDTKGPNASTIGVDTRELLKSAHELRLRRTGGGSGHATTVAAAAAVAEEDAKNFNNKKNAKQKKEEEVDAAGEDRIQSALKEVEKVNRDHLLQQLHPHSSSYREDESATDTSHPFNRCAAQEPHVEEAENGVQRPSEDHRDGIAAESHEDTDMTSSPAPGSTASSQTTAYTSTRSLTLTLPVRGGVEIDVLWWSERVFAVAWVIITVILVRRSAVWFWMLLVE